MANKLKVMLIDDDLPMLNYLKKMVDWTDLGCEEVRSYSSGSQALTDFRVWEPDLVISDIGMPQIDGITLAGKMKELNPEFMLVFLTCHEEFDFARKAIGLQAERYIIKDELSKSELGAVFEEVCRKASDMQLVSQEKAKQGFEQQKAAFVKWLISPIDQEEPKQHIWYESSYRIAYMHVKSEYDPEANTRTSLKKLYLSVSEQISDKESVDVFLVDEGLLFIMNYKDSIKQNYAGRFQRLLGDICDDIKNRDYSVSAKVYTQAMTFSELSESVRSLLFKKQNGYFTRGSLLILLQTLQPEVCHPVNHVIQDSLNLASQAVMDDDTDRINQAMALLLDQVYDMRVHPEEIEERLIKMVYQLEIKKGTEHSDVHFAKRLKQSVTFEEAWIMTRQKLHSLQTVPESSQVLPVDTSKLKRIDEYISSHLHESITSTDVAKALYLNSSYFSRYFRKATGKRFTDYVYEYKIKIARDYLKYSNESIEEIGAELGFTERTYFSKVFKKYTGMTPSEFRTKTQSNEKEGVSK
ncbi:response regulator transcription factor [Salisediminibacterium selenitireducens]|uniref:Two component transcriptional regulator, AraC family n=1 Tax=Bacillus selenitireducens (strain ATCC 700615 / DSM 15326 / MLS10) TaxID=439292 RepID=D6XXD1_BACIE|nr:helix-turn-helix domain-containing protein [Salisediminibacterium selenitireducens]ADH97988.1 two component transcriptional regulator, AraC family [[Bacillus] selenitireducens MLS10]